MQPPQAIHVSIPSNQQSWTYKTLQVFQEEAAKFGVNIVIHDSGKMYKQGEEIGALMQGVLDAATISMEDVSGKLPKQTMYTALCRPFLYRNFAHVTACFDAPWAKGVFEELQNANLVVLTQLLLGTRVVKLYSEQDTFVGARLRIPAGERWRELANILDVQGVEVGNNDVKKACLEGRIDGDETPLPQTLAYGIFPEVKQMFDTQHKVDWVFLTVSKRAWNGLSEQQQHGLKVAAQIARKFNDEHRMQEEVRLKNQYAHLFKAVDTANMQRRAFYADGATGAVNGTSHRAVIEQHRLWPGLGQANCKTGTLLALDDKNILACWYGGKELPEIVQETGLWVANYSDCMWSKPRCLFQEEGIIVWNPVAVKLSEGMVALFFRTFPSKFKNESNKPFTSHVLFSEDNGASWTTSKTLPQGITGPIKCPPIQLEKGKWLIGTAENKKCSLELLDENSHTFTKLMALPQDLPMSEPCLIPDLDGTVQIYFRNRQEDEETRFVMKAVYNPTTGQISALEPTTIPNPDSGIDGIRLKDGRMLLVGNASHISRTDLQLMISGDNGKTWDATQTLEEGDVGSDYSQPALIQTADGLVHIMYCWWKTQEERNIKHVILDPTKL